MLALPQRLEVVAEGGPQREEVLGLDVALARPWQHREEDAAVTEAVACVTQQRLLLADVNARCNTTWPYKEMYEGMKPTAGCCRCEEALACTLFDEATHHSSERFDGVLVRVVDDALHAATARYKHHHVTPAQPHYVYG